MLSVICIHEKPLLFVCTLRLDRPSNGKLFGDYHCIPEGYCLVCTMPFFSTIMENMPVGRFHNNTPYQSYLLRGFIFEAFLLYCSEMLSNIVIIYSHGDSIIMKTFVASS